MGEYGWAIRVTVAILGEQTLLPGDPTPTPATVLIGGGSFIMS